jgi:hypothetical protein
MASSSSSPAQSALSYRERQEDAATALLVRLQDDMQEARNTIKTAVYTLAAKLIDIRTSACFFTAIQSATCTLSVNAVIDLLTGVSVRDGPRTWRLRWRDPNDRGIFFSRRYATALLGLLEFLIRGRDSRNFEVSSLPWTRL